MMTTIRTALLASFLVGACATTTPQPAPSSAPGTQSGPELASAAPTAHAAPAPAEALSDAEVAEISAAAQRFVQAKAARDFATMWDLSAQVYRAMIVSVGRRPAESDPHIARAQGFESPDAVRALDDRAYFIHNRERLAQRSQYVYADGTTVTRLDVRPVIHLPFADERIAVHPVVVTLSDGTQDKIAAIKEGDGWRFLEK